MNEANREELKRVSKYYNPNTKEKLNEFKTINGDPSGVCHFGKDVQLKSLWDIMLSYTWFIGECNISSSDKVAYANLSDEAKYAFNMALGQIIVNDSIQTSQLMDSIADFITNVMARCCLTRQAYEEALHSSSYTTVAEEIVGDEEKIYNLHNYEPALARKNQAVADMYSMVTQEGLEPTNDEKQMALAANQILEELVFPGSFMVIWSIGIPGASKVISFIERDEKGSHVPLFKILFKRTVNEVGITENNKTKIINLIKHMCDEEKIWTKHISKGLLGFSDRAIDMFIEYQANSVSNNLGLGNLYEVTDGGPLKSLYNDNSMLAGNSKKTNQFETAVGDYDVGGMDDDY